MNFGLGRGILGMKGGRRSILQKIRIIVGPIVLIVA
jgi:hypothetical protein